MAFHGRVAVVTGAASGLGRVCAHRLAAAGAQVAALDLNAAGLAETASASPFIRPWICDVADGVRVRTVLDEVRAALGPIDRVTHCAAIMPTALLAREEPERALQVMRVNYGGTVQVVTAALPPMLARGSGDLVVFGSVAAYALTPHLGAYCASKAAVHAFVETLIWENRGSGVRIHLTCPPLVDTPLIAHARGWSDPRSLRDGVTKGYAAKPEAVVDAVETALERGQGVSFPGMAKPLYWLRRLMPSLLWRIILRSEDDTRSGRESVPPGPDRKPPSGLASPPGIG